MVCNTVFVYATNFLVTANFSPVFPPAVKQRLVSELEKRLDLDIDDILESPKLRLKTSPAELDQQLLKLYNDVAGGPRGDVFRVIGGGQEVAFQDLYIKQSASKKRGNLALNSTGLSFGPFEALNDDSDENPSTASQWVKRALRNNLQGDGVSTSKIKQISNSKTENNLKMTTRLPHARCHTHQSRIPWATQSNAFCPPRKSLSFSVLI